PMADSPAPAPTIAISAVTLGTALGATSMTKVDSTHYTYLYTVQAGNGTATVTVGAGRDVAGNALTAAPTSGSTFIVDNTKPTASIAYLPTGPVKQGTTLTMTATFSEAMADSPVVQFAVSGANIVAPTNTIKTDATHYTGSYVVGAGDGTATVALSTGTDAAGNPITATPTTGATFIVDNAGPAISSVSPPVNGSYKAGQNLDFKVAFNENATVVGAPAIGLTIGSTAHSASYVSGSGTSALLFRYTIGGSDYDSDGIAISSSINLNGGTIRDAAGNDAGLNFGALTASGVLIDGI